VAALDACGAGAEPSDIIRQASQYNYVFMNEHSVDAALFAAGGTVAATQAVLRGEVDCAACVVRPPGHHSECGCAMGFA
jgi:histone deacetylase 6